MNKHQIIPMSELYIESFWEAVGSVARERKFLAFLDAPPFESTRAFVQENLREGWPFVIAVIENRVIGWCDISALDRPVYAHAGSLGIGVIAEFRRYGVGEALMRAAISKARDKGLTRVELTVREHNKPAIALYEKLGFKVEGVHRNAIYIDNHYENQLSMALLFE